MASRQYLAYAINYRHIEELMAERGVKVDHSTVNRWVIEYAPQLENEFRKKHNSEVGCS
jgi:putative transposase